MSFSSTDDYFPFHHLPDGSSSPVGNSPVWPTVHPFSSTLRSVLQELHYPSNYSNTPQPHVPSPLFNNYAANSSSLDSINPDAYRSSNSHHVELAKITEYETWSVSQPANMQMSADSSVPSYTSTLSTYQQDNHLLPSPKTEYTCHRRSPLARANSGNGKILSRPGSSEGSFRPNRRMSTSGMPEASPPIHTTNGLPVEKVEGVKSPPNAKSPSKISHSITERRYRENLNSKIVQLDRTLSSTRSLKGQAQNPEAEDGHYLESPVKARKADVLNEAMRYIKQAEHDSEARDKEIDFLRLRLAALEKLVNCGDCVLLKKFADRQVKSRIDF